jgi:hypothetical protein
MTSDPTNTASPRSARAGSAGHEHRDVVYRPVVVALAGLVVLLVAAVLLMRLLLVYLAAYEARTSPPANPLAKSFGREQPPAPRLQADPLRDLLALRAEEDAVLGSYGWVDRDTGVVHIPIGRAIELLAQRGLPARSGGRRGAQ